MANPALNLLYNDYEMRMDIDGRADLQPVYQYFAPSETPTDEKRWTGFKFSYGASGDITRRQIRFKVAWDDRATSF